MHFELNEYHRNISNEDLIADVKNVAKKINKNSLTRAEYSAHGKYHSSTIERRFGSWLNVLELCDFNTNGHIHKYIFTDIEVITDLKRVASLLNTNTLSKQKYSIYGNYPSEVLAKKYGSWNNVLKLAGMEVNLNRNFTNEEMFEEIERIWILLGRQPTTTDIKSGISTFSLQSYARRFGGWRGALQAFINYINDDTTSDKSGDSNIKNDINTSLFNPEVITHKTSRDINLRLRFMVMQRDNFKCCACGASPAKDPAVVLHIDHIKPWAKGGETIMDNLQTLCSKCNLGKSDMM